MAHPRPQHGHARGDCSALDLLSRVALEQYAPPARRHWQLPAPPAPPDMCAPFAYECLPPLRSPDYSPVSSDDGSLRARAVSPRRALRLDKFVAIAKDPHSPRARTQPSRFCHICSRTSKKVGLIACGNFATGACRKVVCQKCFNE